MSEYGWQRFAQHCVESEFRKRVASWKKENVHVISTPFGDIEVIKSALLTDDEMVKAQALTRRQIDMLLGRKE